MMLMFEKSIRRGIIEAVKCYLKTKNNFMKNQYNPNKKSIYLQYLGTGNLYGWAMIQKLPKHGPFTGGRKKFYS